MHQQSVLLNQFRKNLGECRAESLFITAGFLAGFFKERLYICVKISTTTAHHIYKQIRTTSRYIEKELNISSIYSSIPPVTAGCLCIQNGIQMISFPPPPSQKIFTFEIDDDFSLHPTLLTPTLSMAHFMYTVFVILRIFGIWSIGGTTLYFYQRIMKKKSFVPAYLVHNFWM